MKSCIDVRIVSQLKDTKRYIQCYWISGFPSNYCFGLDINTEISRAMLLIFSVCHATGATLFPPSTPPPKYMYM